MVFQHFVCAWNVLDDSHKILLGNCFIIFGVVGLGLNTWLFITFLRSSFLTSRSHLLLLANCIACLLRGLLVFPFASLSALLTRWIFGYTGCQLFAFMKLAAGVFRVASFTLLAAERVMCFKYHGKGNEVPYKFYIISLIMSWVAATFIATLPLVGVGRFTFDMTCTLCDLDWKIRNTFQIGYNISLAIIIGILPTLIIFMCLCTAAIKESKNYVGDQHRSLTRAVTVMTVLTYLFWLPRGILILWIPLVTYRIPKALAVMAPLCSEATTILPVLTYLVYLPTLRSALITILAIKRRGV